MVQNQALDGLDFGELSKPPREFGIGPIALSFILAGLIVWIATLKFGFVLPAAILALVYMVWSFSRPVVAISTIILLHLHLLEFSEGISPLEVGFGVYFFGFIGFWFFKKIFIEGRAIISSSVDFFLVSYLLICFLSFLIIVASESSALMWLREFLMIATLLLYFPLREVMQNDRHLKVILGSSLIMIGTVAIINVVNYRTASLAATYMWELLGSRKSFGDHYFFPSVIIVMSLLISAKRTRQHLFLVVALLLFGLALALTFSRGFWLAAVFGLLVVFFLAERKGKRRLILVSSLIMGGAILVLFFLMGESARQIFDVLLIRLMSTEGGLRDISVAERLAESKALISLIKGSPLIGYGVGATFTHYNIILKRTTEAVFIHNGYLFLLYKVGILGAALFLAYYASLIRAAFKLLKTIGRDSFLLPLLRGFLATIVGMLLVSLTSNIFVTKQSLLILALASAFLMSRRGYAVVDLDGK